MKRKTCCICLNDIELEEPDILAMGGFGTPRYLCPECAADIECATSSREYDDIVAAMDRISKNLDEKNIDDGITLPTVTKLLLESAKRARAIEDGSYDFALDEREDEYAYDEIPEELRETEEDRLLDEADRVEGEKLDRLFNWLWVAIIFGAVAFMVWWFFLR